MPAAVRAPKKMDDRQSTGIRARRSPKTCMEEAHATSANSTDLVEFAEVASATCSPGETPLRSRNNKQSEMHVRTPHFGVPRLLKIAEPAKLQLYVVLRSTVKRVSHMRTGRGTGRNACMQFFAATSFWSVFGSRLTQRIFEIPVPKKVRPAGFFSDRAAPVGPPTQPRCGCAKLRAQPEPMVGTDFP